MKFLRRASSYLLRYRGLFYLTLTLTISSTAFGLAIPLVVKWIFTIILEPQRLEFLWLGMAAVAACFLLRELLNVLGIRANSILGQRVLFDLRRDLHSQLLRLPIGFYDGHKSGEIVSRVTEDVQHLEQGLLDGTGHGMIAVLNILGGVLILFWIRVELALLVVLPLPVLLMLGWQHWRKTRRNWNQVRKAAGHMGHLLVEDIQGNRLVHSFGLRERQHSRFLIQAQRVQECTLKAMFRWSFYYPSSNFIAFLGTVAVVGLGGLLLVKDETFLFGDFLAFFLYCTMLHEPIMRLNIINNLLAAAKVSGERIFEILDHPIDVTSPKQPLPFPSGPMTVRYTGVDFAYSNRTGVVHGLNCELTAGQVTALVGHTGAGKSTLANLLLRYYDVTRGSVTINGIDVRQLCLDTLRKHIGYVSQDPFLFDGTVRDNLVLAKDAASEPELINSLKQASAWEFVSRLPQGLDTPIGEKGVRLSMGEKQRLTIARVLLRDPALVILDEATASVDTITEQQIQQALDNLRRNRTVLVIAHRLSTIRNADQILVLDHGRIIERGSHEMLLKQAGTYARLWQIHNG